MPANGAGVDTNGGGSSAACPTFGFYDPRQLGREIAQHRRAARLSQAEFGGRLKPPVTRQTVSRWERGHCLPDRKHLTAIGELLGEVNT